MRHGLITDLSIVVHPTVHLRPQVLGFRDRSISVPSDSVRFPMVELQGRFPSEA